MTPELLRGAGVDRGGLATRARSGTPGGGEDEARGQTAQAEEYPEAAAKVNPKKNFKKNLPGLLTFCIYLYIFVYICIYRGNQAPEHLRS